MSPQGDGQRTMAGTNEKLTAAIEDYLDDLRRIRSSGGATGERSYYPPLTNLLNAVGSTLKPKVFCVSELAQQGAGHPDIGLYAAKQMQRGRQREGQLPEGGVVEVKPVGDDAWLTADGDQVSRYWDRYRLVLVTNTRDFVLLVEDAQGRPAKLETFRLAGSAADLRGPKLQTATDLRPRRRPRSGGISLPRPVAPSRAGRTPRSGPAAGLLCSRRPGPGRGGGRRTIAQCRAIGAGGGAGRPIRGRAGRSLLPLDFGADPLLRRFLRLGPLGPADAATYRNLQLA